MAWVMRASSADNVLSAIAAAAAMLAERVLEAVDFCWKIGH